MPEAAGQLAARERQQITPARLKRKFRTQLDEPGRKTVGADGAKIRVTKCRVRVAEVRIIEEIEEICFKTQAAILASEAGVFSN